jgi:hypothetical protein
LWAERGRWTNVYGQSQVRCEMFPLNSYNGRKASWSAFYSRQRWVHW